MKPANPRIAAGLIESADHQLLIVLPISNVEAPRVWQFPREMVQPKESPESAMRRLAVEKLGLTIEISVGQPPFLAQLEGRTVEMRYFLCEIVEGLPRESSFAEVRWINRAHLREYEFDAASQPVAEWLLAE